MLVIYAEFIEYIYDKRSAGIRFDPWEEQCKQQIAAMFGLNEIVVHESFWDIKISPDVLWMKKEQLHLFRIADCDHLGKFEFYRRPIDIERLTRWEQGERHILLPEEWS